MRSLAAALMLALAACSTGPAAPPVGEVALACAEGFCITYPAGWETEVGDTYISFSYPDSPALATVSPISQQALIENAGGAWPAPTEDVVRAFWQLLEEAEVASLEHIERLAGGWYRSEGAYEGGKLWHLLIPGSGDRAVAIEVRGPNATWEAHADAFFGGVEVLE